MQNYEDKFFNPNICHVCKKRYFNQICECRLVSYCSTQHKLEYMGHHMEICEALKKLYVSHPQFWSTSGLSLTQWIQTRKEFISLIKLQLQRELGSHEVEMIMLSKSCGICREQGDLMFCRKCYYANFCISHYKTIHPNCEELETCLVVNTDEILLERAPMLFTQLIDKSVPVVNMESFIENYMFKRTSVSDVWNAELYLYSDYVSGPLTLQHVMEKLNLLNVLETPLSFYVIHIIAPDIIDKEHLNAWEIFLHIVREIKEMKIIIISPLMHCEHGDIKLCMKCSKSNRGLVFETYGMLYPNYIASQYYEKPNAIIAFQANLKKWVPLHETILKIQEQGCPILLTTKTGLEAERNLTTLIGVLGFQITYPQYLAYNDQNKFVSKRPHKDLETDGVFYRNKYLTVFKKL